MSQPSPTKKTKIVFFTRHWTWLTKEARRRGLSRSQLIRHIVDLEISK